MDGTLSPGGTINYATGAFTISPCGMQIRLRLISTIIPDLPVMGLEDLL